MLAPCGVGRLCLLDDWVTWSLPQLFRALAVPHLFLLGIKMKRVLLFALIIAAWAFAEETCLDLCSSCMSESKPDACSKVETLCKCSSLVENLRQELQSKDSVAVDSPVVDSSAVDSSVVDTSVVDSPAVAKTVADTSATESLVADSSAQVQVQVKETASEDTTKQAVKDSESASKGDEMFYMGVSVGYEHYYEHEVAGVHMVDDYQWGVNLGFLLRWYLYHWGSFQTGINAVYHQAEHESQGGGRDIDYQSIMFEIPLQVRLGVPLGKTPISPFVSLNAYIRKPVYAWVEYSWTREHQSTLDLGGGYYQYSAPMTEYLVDESADGFYKSEDWEFLEYVGIGIEFNRFISLQWQFLLLSTVTYSDYQYYGNYFNNTNADEITWRVILDIAW